MTLFPIMPPVGSSDWVYVGKAQTLGYSVTAPSDIQENDVLIFSHWIGGTDDSGAASGFTTIYNHGNGTSYSRTLYKVADGTEGGTTITQDGSTNDGRCILLVFRPPSSVSTPNVLDMGDDGGAGGTVDADLTTYSGPGLVLAICHTLSTSGSQSMATPTFEGASPDESTTYAGDGATNWAEVQFHWKIESEIGSYSDYDVTKAAAGGDDEFSVVMFSE